MIYSFRKGRTNVNTLTALYNWIEKNLFGQVKWIKMIFLSIVSVLKKLNPKKKTLKSSTEDGDFSGKKGRFTRRKIPSALRAEKLG